MPGFIIKIESNNKYWYLLGTILFLLLGVGLAIGGFLSGSTPTGITGIVIGLAALVLVIDAFMNL
ncbi:MAG: hypothetical protein HUJ28_00080 [Chromatiales bacterium]|nr:hypothetical protein [Chromatiales bacterium]